MEEEEAALDACTRPVRANRRRRREDKHAPAATRSPLVRRAEARTAGLRRQLLRRQKAEAAWRAVGDEVVVGDELVVGDEATTVVDAAVVDEDDAWTRLDAIEVAPPALGPLARLRRWLGWATD